MAFLSTLNIIGSGLTAQQLRLDVISENVTNMNTTRTEGGGPYRRKVTRLESESGKNGFRMAMAAAEGRLRRRSLIDLETPGSRSGPFAASNRGYEMAGGVRVAAIEEDPSDLRLVYDPTHPDANDEGYLEMPNVILVKEVTDAMAASQAYAADVTALNTFKQVVAKAMEIGR